MTEATPNSHYDLAAALDTVVQDFDALQTQLTYRQAQGTLQTLLERLTFTPRETTHLQSEVQQLTRLLTKLEQAVVHIAVFGLVGRGKSSLLNALLGSDVFATGPTHGVTQQQATAPWQIHQEAASAGQSLWRVSPKSTQQARIELIDTPGLDEVDGVEQEKLAQQVAQSADLILFVVAGDMTRREYGALATLQRQHKPLLLVFNKVDQYPPRDRQAIFETLRAQRLHRLIDPGNIVMAAAAPLETEAIRQADGQLITRRVRGTPQISDLKLKILDVLQREGLALVALNTLLYANDLDEAIREKKLHLRDRAAEEVIWQGTLAKAIAVALNPITGIDVLTGAVVDVTLLVTLARLYGLPLTQQGAVKLLQTIALELGGLSVSELLVTAGLSSLKGVLGLATPATLGMALPPYLAVAVTQATVAGVASYSLGQVAKVYFANGASWGSHGPKVLVKQILATVDEDGVLHRIKDELLTKINPLDSAAVPTNSQGFNSEM
ncbi:MAG: GTP-binding protein [Leptolyngbyaceae cyanobacterium]